MCSKVLLNASLVSSDILLNTGGVLANTFASFGGTFAGVGPAPTFGFEAGGIGGDLIFGSFGTGGSGGGTCGAPGTLGGPALAGAVDTLPSSACRLLPCVPLPSIGE